MKNLLISKLLEKDKKGVIFWIIGFLAFIWIIVRSGTNPKRFTYPCQKAAYPLATTWFIAVIGFSGVTLLKKTFKISVPVLIIAVVGWLFLSDSKYLNFKKVGNYPTWEATNPISEVYVFDRVPLTTGSLSAGNASVPDSYLSDPGIDSLVSIMESGKTPFFKTSNQLDGIIGNNDIVIIKGNFQWRHKMSTNTDRMKGVIWQILNHPEGFTGEIIIAENTEKQTWEAQSHWLAGLNDYGNNSEDPEQSIVDVVNTFKAKGYNVDYYVLDDLNMLPVVDEYNEGDLTDGYIFNRDELWSYPKFKSPGGSYISMRYGVWDESRSSFDSDRLSIINMPVLKRHGMVGATIALKNWIGVMNTAQHDDWFGGWVDDTFHPLYCFSEYALVARELDIVWPKLNIIDATWVATENNYNHEQTCVNAKTILASTDPVAVSWYAAKYILEPIAVNSSRVNPDNVSGSQDDYGTVLNYWYNYLNDSTERDVTKDPNKISVYSRIIPATNIQNEERTTKNKIKIYPNPSSDGLYYAELDESVKSDFLYISDNSGKLIEKINHLNTKKIEINLSKYPNGFYYLTYNQNNIKNTVKIIKGE